MRSEKHGAEEFASKGKWMKTFQLFYPKMHKDNTNLGVLVSYWPYDVGRERMFHLESWICFIDKLTLRKFPLPMQCFDADQVTEKGHKNHYKNRNDNYEPNGYMFGRCGGNKRKCQSVNFSKLPDYTLDGFCVPAIQMKIPAHLHSRWKTPPLKSFWCLVQ